MQGDACALPGVALCAEQVLVLWACAPGRCIYTFQVMLARGGARGLWDWLASHPLPGGLGSRGWGVRGERSEPGVRLRGIVGIHSLHKSGGSWMPGYNLSMALVMLEKPLWRQICCSLTLFKALVAPELLGGPPRKGPSEEPPKLSLCALTAAPGSCPRPHPCTHSARTCTHMHGFPDLCCCCPSPPLLQPASAGSELWGGIRKHPWVWRRGRGRVRGQAGHRTCFR